MSFTDFAEDLFIKTIDTSETPILGGFQLDADLDLAHIVLHFIINDLAPTTETLKIQVHGESSGNSLIVESSSVDCTDIGNNFVGGVRFDFDKTPLSSDFQYWLKLVPANYTRASKDKYFGYLLNWPDGVGTGFSLTSPLNNSAKFEVYGEYDESI